MKKAILVLLISFVAAHVAECALAAQSLAEEFARCSAFNEIAAACAQNGTREQQEQAAKYQNAAKSFYRGGHRLAGQEFMRNRRQVHDTAMRRRAGATCEGFPALEQQHQKRCDDNAGRLPR